MNYIKKNNIVVDIDYLIFLLEDENVNQDDIIKSMCKMNKKLLKKY
jgi:hypothetical protein